jgi:hypothetical protein
MFFLLFALVVQAPLRSGNLGDEIEAARRQCHEKGSWPDLPGAVEGCVVDWSDAASIAAHVQWPSKKPSATPDLPSIPADETLKPNPLVLEYWINSSGGVEDVCVLRSVSPTVDTFFVELARSAEFRPGTLCGVSVSFSVTVGVNHHAWEWPRLPRVESPPNPGTAADGTRRFAPGGAAERQGRWAAWRSGALR